MLEQKEELQQEKAYHTDCFSFSCNNCIVLIKCDCIGCKFYKTKEQYLLDQFNAQQRLESLPNYIAEYKPKYVCKKRNVG